MKSIRFSLLLILSSLIFFSGCSDSDNDDAPAAPVVAAGTLEGTAATGAAIEGDVVVKDANGIEATIASSADGSFTLDVASLTAPFLLKIMPAGGTDSLYSYASADGQTVNLTPATNLVMFLASGKSNLDTLYAGWDGTGVTAAQVDSAEDTVRANLEDQINAAGLDASAYDLMSTPFAADSTGFDGVLDDITIVVDSAGGTFTFDDGAGNTTFDESATPTPPTTTSGNSVSIVTISGGTHELNGTYTTGCHGDGDDSVEEILVYSGTTWNYTSTLYMNVADCSGTGIPSTLKATISAGAELAITGWVDGTGSSATAPGAEDSVTTITDTEAFTPLSLTITEVGGAFAGQITVGFTTQLFYIVDDTGANPVLYRDDDYEDNSLEAGIYDPYTQQ